MSIDLGDVQWFPKARRGAMPETEPLVTVSPSGRVALNRPLFTKLSDELPEAIQFGFVRDNSVIVLKAANVDDKDAYRLRESGRTMFAGAPQLLAQVGYRLDQSTRFHATVDSESGVAYFSLNEPMPEKSIDPAPKKRGRPRKNPE